MTREKKLSHKERSLLAAQKEQDRLDKLARIEERRKLKRQQTGKTPSALLKKKIIKRNRHIFPITCPNCKTVSAEETSVSKEGNSLMFFFTVVGGAITFAGIGLILFTLFSSQYEKGENLLPLFDSICLLFLVTALTSHFLRKKTSYVCNNCGFIFTPGKVPVESNPDSKTIQNQ